MSFASIFSRDCPYLVIHAEVSRSSQRGCFHFFFCSKAPFFTSRTIKTPVRLSLSLASTVSPDSPDSLHSDFEIVPGATSSKPLSQKSGNPANPPSLLMACASSAPIQIHYRRKHRSPLPPSPHRTGVVLHSFSLPHPAPPSPNVPFTFFQPSSHRTSTLIPSHFLDAHTTASTLPLHAMRGKVSRWHRNRNFSIEEPNEEQSLTPLHHPPLLLTTTITVAVCGVCCVCLFVCFADSHDSDATALGLPLPPSQKWQLPSQHAAGPPTTSR